jgi:hypothetical protein
LFQRTVESRHKMRLVSLAKGICSGVDRAAGYGKCALDGATHPRDGKRLKKNRNTQSGPSQQDVWKDYARRMVEEQVRDRGVTHEATLAALLETPRHAFAPEAALKDAYGISRCPLAIIRPSHSRISSA